MGNWGYNPGKLSYNPTCNWWGPTLYLIILKTTPEARKKKTTFRYTGWLIGILTMVYCNPYITG